MRKCIAIDWLQCHVKMPIKDFENLFNPMQSVTVKDGKGNWVVSKVENSELKELDNRYLLERTGFQTRNFKAIFEIRDRVTNEEIAVIAAEPRSEMCMKADSGLIKIVNKYLYQRDLKAFSQALFKDLRLQLINITRYDIAGDFLSFDTMPCQEFINEFASQNYLKKQQSKFKMMGDTWSVNKGKITGGISSLKFGLETSDVNYYLYNKTLELEQVKDKPWIKEHWKTNGWDGSAAVWRLEFSLHATTDGIAVITPDGELEQVYQFKDWSMLDHIEDIYSHLVNKYFQFVYREQTKKGNIKKQSRSTALVLFTDLTFQGVKISLSDKKDSGRSSKIFAKNLMKLNQELRGQDFELAIMGNELMTWIIKRHALDVWAEKKLPGIHLSDRVVQIFEQSRNAKLLIEMQALQDLPSIYPNQKEQEKEMQEFLEVQKIKLMQIKQQRIVEADLTTHSFDIMGNDLGYSEPLPF